MIGPGSSPTFFPWEICMFAVQAISAYISAHISGDHISGHISANISQLGLLRRGPSLVDAL